MIDLSSSSDEEDLIVNTSHDEELARRLFGDLNCAVIGPPGDGKIIILSDSDEEEEEEEVSKEKTNGTEDVATSTAINPASTASADADDAPTGVKNDNSDERIPDHEADGSNDSKTMLGCLRLPCQEGT
jgi:hypothetical protein